MKRSINSLSLLAMAIVGLTLVGCTKHKDLKDMVANTPYMAKADIDGKTFSFVRGVEEADSDSPADTVPGESIDFGLVRARLTENELQLLEVFNPQGREETAKILASYPIVDQFDIKREENDFNEQTHRVVEDRKAPWKDRKFVRIDWTRPTNNPSKFMTTNGYSGASEENTTLLEAPKVENGHISWLVETSVQGRKTYTGARVVYRTHLMPLKSSDYQPIAYTRDDFAKFGYFMTWQLWEDPLRGLLDSTVKTYANTFNVCEPGTGRSCSTNKIVWHLNKGFPDKYVKASELAVKQWNLAFKAALGRSDDVVVFEPTKRVDRVDPRYNTIHLFEPDTNNPGGYGVAQWVDNPMTGEMITARANVYGSLMRDSARTVDIFIDSFVSNPSAVKAVLAGTSTSAKNAYLSDLKRGGVEFIKRQKSMRKTLGMDKVSITNASSPRAAAKAILPALTGSPEKATESKRSLMRAAPTLLAFDEISKIGGLADLSHREESVSASDQQNGVESLNGIENLLLLGDKRKEARDALLADAESGKHGPEMVEEALLNYLMMLAKTKNPKDLLAKREQIKAEVEQRVYYMVLMHELGHTFGLRHNFAGSVDEANYVPEYHAKLKEVIAGKADAAELAPYQYSSVMEYVAEFHMWHGGVGPYDVAALRYAYNRKAKTANNTSDPILSRNYRFCTDHEVGEDPLCNRSDKGRNLSEITLNRIEDYKRDYVLTHFRRDRAKFDTSSRRLYGRALYVMVPVRQVMDEFIYKLINDREPNTPASKMNAGACDKRWMSESVDRGEIVNICNPVESEANGVDPTDLSTLSAGLIDPSTGAFRKDPKTYLPEGLADLTFANAMAQEFFESVIGAPEPGTYMVVPTGEKSAYGLMRLPEGGDDLAKVTALAEARKISPADRGDFIAKALKILTDVTVFDHGRYFSSEYETTGKFERLARAGFAIDKMAAINVLSTNYLGVRKYARENMLGNPYTYPHTKRYMSRLIGNLVTQSNQIASIPVKLRGGQTIRAQVGASLSRDTQSMSTVVALTDLVLDGSNMGMLDRLRICAEGESGCVGNQVVEFISASGQQKYRAAQLMDNDSIAFSLVSDAAAIDQERRQWLVKLAKAPEVKAEFANKLDGFIGSLKAVDEKYFANSPDLSGLRDALTSREQSANSVLQILEMLKEDAGRVQTFTTQEIGRFVHTRLSAAIGEIDGVLTGSACKNAAKKERSCVASESPTGKVAMTELKAELQKIHQAVVPAINEVFEASYASNQVERKTAELARVEANIFWVRKIFNVLGYR